MCCVQLEHGSSGDTGLCGGIGRGEWSGDGVMCGLLKKGAYCVPGAFNPPNNPARVIRLSSLYRGGN